MPTVQCLVIPSLLYILHLKLFSNLQQQLVRILLYLIYQHINQGSNRGDDRPKEGRATQIDKWHIFGAVLDIFVDSSKKGKNRWSRDIPALFGVSTRYLGKILNLDKWHNPRSHPPLFEPWYEYKKLKWHNSKNNKICSILLRFSTLVKYLMCVNFRIW